LGKLGVIKISFEPWVAQTVYTLLMKFYGSNRPEVQKDFLQIKTDDFDWNQQVQNQMDRFTSETVTDEDNWIRQILVLRGEQIKKLFTYFEQPEPTSDEMYTYRYIFKFEWNNDEGSLYLDGIGKARTGQDPAVDDRRGD